MRAHGRPSFTRPRHAPVPVAIAPLFWLGLAVSGCASHPNEGNLTAVEQGDCLTCHADDLATTANPPHVEAQFAETCGDCHDETTWLEAPRFAHTTKFALTLGHAAPGCNDCHSTTYAPGQVPNRCVDCHGGLADGVLTPQHNGLSTDCFACHRTDSFFPSYFVHSWPLIGKHDLLACISCHTGDPAPYEGISSACVGCHAAAKARADMNVPGHADFGVACEGCHTPEGF
jgi:predicted CXXCH cytochrome family protein